MRRVVLLAATLASLVLGTAAPALASSITVSTGNGCTATYSDSGNKLVLKDSSTLYACKAYVDSTLRRSTGALARTTTSTTLTSRENSGHRLTVVAIRPLGSIYQLAKSFTI